MRLRVDSTIRPIVIAAAVLALAAPAAGQRARATAHEPLVVGGSVGFDSSSADNYPGGPELAGLIEVPLSRDWRLRGDVGIGFWDDEGPPPFNDDDDIELRRHRITASLVKTVIPMSGNQRWAVYAGGGAGIYRYIFGDNSTAAGIHGVGGLEYALPRSRWLVGGEAQFQVIGAPDAPGDDDAVKVFHVAGVVKYRLRRP
jgi:hypothetical protein